MASFVPSWQGEGSPAGGTSDYFKCALIQLEEEVAATQTEKAAVMAQHNLNDIDDCGLWWSLESLRETLESYRKEAAALAAEACETL